jgi:SAM-dependent methyltransferase
MNSSLLVRIFGWRASLFHGDPLVFDRWRWICKRLRKTKNKDALLDVGCGSGAFTIGTAKKGYQSLGLSWDERNQTIAQSRAAIANAPGARFEICDVRDLDKRTDLHNEFDIILCCENIEHIIDDFKLTDAMAKCLKPGGRLLLTSPYIRRLPWSSMDYGPFPDFEDGRHVRRGYNRTMLAEMSTQAGLVIEEFSYLSGPISQLGAYIQVQCSKIHPLFGWLVILPLRPFPPLLDRWIGPLLGIAPFCIGIEAVKPRKMPAAAVQQSVAAG